MSDIIWEKTDIGVGAYEDLRGCHWVMFGRDLVLDGLEGLEGWENWCGIIYNKT